MRKMVMSQNQTVNKKVVLQWLYVHHHLWTHDLCPFILTLMQIRCVCPQKPWRLVLPLLLIPKLMQCQWVKDQGTGFPLACQSFIHWHCCISLGHSTKCTCSIKNTDLNDKPHSPPKEQCKGQSGWDTSLKFIAYDVLVIQSFGTFSMFSANAHSFMISWINMKAKH